MPDTPARKVVVTGIGAAGPFGTGVPALEACLRGTNVIAGSSAMDLLPDAAQTRARRALRKAPDTLGVALGTAAEAWRIALLDSENADPETAVVVSAVGTAHGAIHRAGDAVDLSLTLQSTPEFCVSLASHVFGTRGAGMVATGAQASGMVALTQAAGMIRNGTARRVLVIGVPVRLSSPERAAYAALGVLAQAARPFDAESEGFTPTELAASLILEDAASALERGATPLVELAATEVQMHGAVDPAPNEAAALRIMQTALRNAHVTTEQLDLVSAHATGTPTGDAAEAGAIATLVGDQSPVNAPKGLIGHGLASAGLIETVICILQMLRGFLHGCPWLQTPRVPGLLYASHAPATVRTVLKTGFGFGGFNAALVLRADGGAP